MLSDIAKAARRRAPVFLLEIDVGETVRLATHNVSFDDRRFYGGLLEVGQVGESFDWHNFGYSPNRVTITAANVRGAHGLRLSDIETYQIMDWSEARLYVYFEDGDLSWSDIESDGLIMRGVFRKDQHLANEHVIDFSIEPYADEVWGTIPAETINTDTWPDLRTDGGGGSVEGQGYPMVFGSHSGGLGLYCCDTSGYRYLVAGHPMKSVDVVYDKDGASIGSGWAATTVVDGRGNVCQLVDFTSDQSANEPLTAAGDGVEDVSGVYTGTAEALVTHPADILFYLITTRTSLGATWADIESIKTARSFLPGVALAATCISEADAGEWIDRLLLQCSLARGDRLGGRHGLVTLDLNRGINRYLHTETGTYGSIAISKTPWELITNWASVDYGHRSGVGVYAGNLLRDRSNHTACADSWLEYGDVGLRKIQYPDAASKAVALRLFDRRMGFFSHRHDLLYGVDLSYCDGWDMRRGHCLAVTIPEGQSRDGNGQFDERHLIVEKLYLSDRIRLTLVRCRPNMDYGGYVTEEAESGGDAVIDGSGDTIVDGSGDWWEP